MQAIVVSGLRAPSTPQGLAGAWLRGVDRIAAPLGVALGQLRDAVRGLPPSSSVARLPRRCLGSNL